MFITETFWPNILHISYTPGMLSTWPQAMQRVWKTFLSRVESLKSHGIETCIVPLSFDAVHNLWWRDYPPAYCHERHPEWQTNKIPHLIVTIRVDANGFAIPDKNNTIWISHAHINSKQKAALLNVFGKDGRFAWNGRQNKEMAYRL